MRSPCSERPQPGNVFLSCQAWHFLLPPELPGSQGEETRGGILTLKALSLESLFVPMGLRLPSSCQTLATYITITHLGSTLCPWAGDYISPSRSTSLPRLEKLFSPQAVPAGTIDSPCDMRQAQKTNITAERL